MYFDGSSSDGAGAALDATESDWLAQEGEPGLVSVIIPTFNRLGFVTELLAALEQQSWRPLEIIVVDDGSTDDSPAVLSQWQPQTKGVRFRLLQKTNGGPGSARNLGCRAARGSFVYFIDSDDLPAPGAIEALATALNGSDSPVCLGHIVQVDMAGTELAYVVPRGDPDHLEYTGWMTHAALYRRSALRAAGPFSERLWLGEDTEMHWRITLSGGAAIVLDRVVGIRREHGQQHLSLGVTPRYQAEASFNTAATFWTWAKAHGHDNAGVRKFMHRQMVICAIGLGECRAFAEKDRAAAIAVETGGSDSASRWLARWVFRPDHAAHFAMLRLSLRAARVIRHPARLSRLWRK